MPKMTAADYKAKEAEYRKLSLEAARQERQNRLLHLGTLIETAGFSMEDTAFLKQALAWLRVMQMDPARWEVLQGGAEESVGGGQV